MDKVRPTYPLKATMLKLCDSQTSRLSLSTSKHPSQTAPQSSLSPKILLPSLLRRHVHHLHHLIQTLFPFRLHVPSLGVSSSLHYRRSHHLHLHHRQADALFLIFPFSVLAILFLLPLGLFLHGPHVRILSHQITVPSLGCQFNQRSELTRLDQMDCELSRIAAGVS